MRHKIMRRLLGAFLTLLLTPLAAASDSELVFGVYPYLSPSQTVEQFAPLKTHLSKTLGRPVSLRSAPDFAKTQQIDFRPLDAATMKRIDPFTAVLEKP